MDGERKEQAIPPKIKKLQKEEEEDRKRQKIHICSVGEK